MIDDRTSTVWYPPSADVTLQALRYASLYRDATRAINALEDARAKLAELPMTQETIHKLDKVREVLRMWRRADEARRDRIGTDQNKEPVEMNDTKKRAKNTIIRTKEGIR